MNPKEALKKYWGYDDFREPQEDVIQTALEGRDCFALLPTGGGKSICYQIPGLVSGKLTLVISPLIALMKDQVSNLEKRNIKAKAIYSGMDRSQIISILDLAVQGRIEILYLSPERLKTEVFKQYLEDLPIGLIAVDEAHCISQWGYDFRPAYMDIADIRERVDAPILALTGSADPQVVDDIITKLNFEQGYSVFKKSFIRPNLCYRVYETEQKLKAITDHYKPNFSAIVYATSRGLTEKTASRLRDMDIDADFYHAGLSSKNRDSKQRNWISEKPPIIVSTNAFGMGIDKPNVRQVFHINPPSSPEAYYQEAGRAGRDGDFATATLFYDTGDIKRLENQTLSKYFDDKEARKMYSNLFDYLELVVGEGADQYFDFDVVDFVTKFKLNLTKTLSFLNFFAQDGFWVFDESTWDRRPVVQVTSEPNQMDSLLQNGYESAYETLQALYRLYQNIRYQRTKITLIQIAQMADLHTDTVLSQLKILHQKGYINLQMPAEKQALYLIWDRFPIKEMSYDHQRLKMLIRTDLKKTKQMVQYMQNRSVCRHRMLVSFFGENASEDCGKCDVCRSGRTKKVDMKILCKFVANLESPHISKVKTQFFNGNNSDFVNWMRLGVNLGWWQISKSGDIKILKEV